MYVVGMGENKTPSAFRKACNIFRILEVISGEQDDHDNADNVKNKATVTSVNEIEDSVCKIITENSNQGKETQIGEIGSKLNLLYPDFDVRNYGYSKLTTFLKTECKSVSLNASKKHIVLTLNERTQDVESIIIHMLRDNGGEIDNISRINVALKKQIPSFNVKNYGYNKFSNFLKSISGVEIVNQNGLKLTKRD